MVVQARVMMSDTIEAEVVNKVEVDVTPESEWTSTKGPRYEGRTPSGQTWEDQATGNKAEPTGGPTPSVWVEVV